MSTHSIEAKRASSSGAGNKLANLLALASACLLLVTCANPLFGSKLERPNIVLLYADDLGWSDLGVYGNSFHRTPHLDAFATQGARFTNAYANAPNCAPSRACLLTGTYTPRHGVFSVTPAARGKSAKRKLLVPKTKRALENSAWTLAEALSEAGYSTASIGKWHLGDDPKEHGFDLNVGGTSIGHPKSYFSPYKNANLPDGIEGEHLTARLTEEAIAFIDQPRTGPFFLYLSYFAVHTPLQGRPDLVAEYEALRAGRSSKLPKPKYAAMVQAMDESVGRLLGHLELRELAHNTLVLFTSDNGGSGAHTSMAPLRGSKGMLYEGGIREPWIVRWPARIKPGRVLDDVVIGTDIFPTFLAAAGVPVPRAITLDGVDLMPLLSSGKALDERAIYWHFPAYLEPYSRSDTRWRATPASAIRAGDYKLIEFHESGRLELYDLGRDLGEQLDLADKLPDERERLHAQLIAWRERVGAQAAFAENPEFEY